MSNNILQINNPWVNMNTDVAFAELHNDISSMNSCKSKSTYNHMPYSQIDILFRIIEKNHFQLCRYYNLLSGCDKIVKECFFRRSVFVEKYVDKKIDVTTLCSYFNCVESPDEDFIENIMNDGDIKILEIFINKFINHIKVDDFLPKINNKILENAPERCKSVISFSKILQRKTPELETVFDISGTENTYLEYCTNWHNYDDKAFEKLIYICKNNFIGDIQFEIKMFMTSYLNNSGRKVQVLEDFFSNINFDESYAKTYNPNLIHILSCYTSRAALRMDMDIKDNKLYSDAFRIFEKIFDTLLKNKDTCLVNFLHQFRNLYCTLLDASEKIRKIEGLPRLNLLENKFLSLLDFSYKKKYIDYHNLSNDADIKQFFIDSKNINDMVVFSIAYDFQFPEFEINPSIYPENAVNYACKFNIKMDENYEESMVLSINSPAIVEKYFEHLIKNNLGSINKSKRFESNFYPNKKLSCLYTSLTNKRFIRFENYILQGLNGNRTYHIDFFIMFNDYCKALKELPESFLKNVLDSCAIKYCFKEDSVNQYKDIVMDKIIDCLKDCVKIPLELFDNSLIGNHPKYLAFKEEYEKSGLSKRKRQRRKLSGVDPQGEGESGQGQQTPAG